MTHVEPAQRECCDQCGCPLEPGESRWLERIEEVRREGASADPTYRGEGRLRWFAPKAHDPEIVASTPRYQYKRRRIRLCARCHDEAVEREEELLAHQRSAVLKVILAAVVVSALLLLTWFFAPGLWQAIGVRRQSAYPVYMHGPPPTPSAYAPPFNASVPAANEGE